MLNPTIKLLLALTLFVSGCAHVKLHNIDGMSGTVSFSTNFRYQAKLKKADYKMNKFCYPHGIPKIINATKDMRYDSGIWVPTPRYGVVNTPGSYEQWVTIYFNCE